VERLCGGFPLARAEIGVLEFGRAYDRYSLRVKPDLTIRCLRQHGTKLLWSIQNVVIVLIKLLIWMLSS